MVLVHFHPIVLHPTQFVFNAEGDSIKNIYVFIWHILYDTDAWQTTSMNYPFGESIFYVGAQPAISTFLQQINKIIPLSGNFWLTTFNYMVVFSIPISALILYRTLRMLDVNKLVSILFSVGIILCSPQVYRLSGHFGLSNMWVIVGSIYLFIRYLHSNSTKALIGLLFVILIGFFIHPYLGIIPLLLVTSTLVINRMLDWKNQSWVKWLPAAFSFIPLILFLFFSTLTDSHEGRVKNPYGFYEYTSTLKGLLLPVGSEISRNWLPDSNSLGEDFNYLGIAGIAMALVSILAVFKGNLGSIFKSLFIASSLLLLFSFGFPFQFGLEAIVEQFPILKVFRSLGRFAWPFYYVVFIIGLVQLPNLFMKLRPNIHFLIYGILGLVLLIEGNRSMHQMGSKLTPFQLFENQSERYDSEDYAAILPLPFYNIGSDNYSCGGTAASVTKSMKLSINTGIPLLAHHGARQSISEAKDLMGLIGRFGYPKSVDSTKIVGQKFLLCSTGENLTGQEFRISMLGQELKGSSLSYVEGSDLYNGQVTVIIDRMPSYIQNFDDRESPITYKGKGSLTLDKNGFANVCDLPQLFKGDHVLRFWVYTGGENYGEGRANNCFIVIEEKDGSGNVNWLTHAPINDSFIYDGDWCLKEIPFTIKSDNKNVSVLLSGSDRSGIQVIIDELEVNELDKDLLN